MMIDFFTNYETDKIYILHPNYYSICLILLIFFLSLLTLKPGESHFLDVVQTNQIRGFAILLVVVGHLFRHVSSNNGYFIFGGPAVAIFLWISGYGLTLSTGKTFQPHIFIKKRLLRVFIPYWIVTIALIVMDRFILGNYLNLIDIFLSMAGINLSPAVKHLDYTRWFITLLLFWYFIFFFTNWIFKQKTAVLLQLLVAFVASGLSLLHLFPGSYYQIMAFPAGCITAINIQKIQTFWATRIASSGSNFLLLICGCCISLILILPFWEAFKTSINKVMWWGIFLSTKGLITIAFTVLILIILNLYENKYSSFLTFCGTISYEIYLIHGSILIKYNPIMGHLASTWLIPGFIILFILIILISLQLKYFTNFLNTLISNSTKINTTSFY